ncbi:hypothetical protein FACS189474_5230 [Bacteroidia bacterium]|nr:hypothetical protein FACS189474_5230 [Bacteroidia bacterium]
MDESRLETRKRIFVCLSSKDRQTVVESIMYHMANFGFAIWYDRHKMLLGDKRNYKNFIEGIMQTEYAIVVMSKNSIESTCVAEEMEYLKKQYDMGLITIFPIFYNILSAELPKKYQWLTELVYKELDEKSGTLLTCNHIITKILSDELKSCKYQTLHELLNFLETHNQDKFIINMLRAYLEISGENHNARISILYSMCIYLSITMKTIDMFPQYYWKGFERIFSYTKLNLDTDLRETLILEIQTMILVNKLYC